MADNEKSLLLKLIAEDGISGVIDHVTKQLGESKLGLAVTAASTAFTAMTQAVEIAGKAYEAIASRVEEVVHAASEHERANQRIAASLQVAGQYSAATAKQLDVLSTSISKQAAISGNSVREAIAFGAAMGMSSDMAARAAQAAVNLSAAMGTDLQTAMMQLNATLSGSSGQLGRQVAELRGFTESQLQAGAAIDFVNERMNGLAATMSNTYAGAQARVEQAHHRFQATLGELVTGSTALRNALAAKAEMYDRLAAAAAGVIHWLDAHQEVIARVVNGLKAAIVVYGIYLLAVNAVAIASGIAAVATGALTIAIAVLTSPVTIVIGIVIALGLAFAALGVTCDHIIGILKMVVAAAIWPLTQQIGLLLYGLGKLISVFNAEWGASIEGASDKIRALSGNLMENGKAQFKAAEETRKNADATKEQAAAAEAAKKAAEEHEQALRRVAAEYARTSENAKPAIDALKEFAPRLSVIDWERDRKNFETQLEQLKAAATVVIKTQRQEAAAGRPSSEADKALLERATADVERASAAQAAIRLKDIQITHDAQIKAVDAALNFEKMRAITVSDEIKLKRIAAAEEIRAKQIEVAAARVMDEENLQRNYLTVQEEGTAKAVATDLAAYKRALDTRLQMAVTSEQQKQAALDAAAKGGVTLDPVAKARVQAKAVENEQAMHQQALTELMRQGAIDRETFERESHASRMMELRSQSAEEIAEHQARADMLGLSDQAVKERQIAAELEYKDRLKEIYADRDMTADERRTAALEADMNFQAEQNRIADENLQAEAARANQRYDQQGVFLANMELAQRRHGAVMGTLVAVQQSGEYQAINSGMSAMASLRNSHSKKAFEIGKAAATAQAVIQGILAANEAMAALAWIPLVGPALGMAMAAAILAAAFVNVQNIQSQKFQGGGHAGIDYVPESMSNSSFLVKGGERVVQPEANKDLTQAAQTINAGGAARSITVNVTIYGTPSADQVNQMKGAIIDAIRDASEKGTPVINERGIVKAS